MSKVIYKIVLMTGLFMISVFSQSHEYKPVIKFDPARDAEKDISEAVAEAGKTGKRIILDVGGEWCIWCHRIDEFIESDEEIKNFLEANYILVKINYSKENKNEELLSKYPKIEGYPHFFVLDEKGKLIHSQNTGELEKDKSYSKSKMMSFLRKWAPEKS